MLKQIKELKRQLRENENSQKELALLLDDKDDSLVELTKANNSLQTNVDKLTQIKDNLSDKVKSLESATAKHFGGNGSSSARRRTNKGIIFEGIALPSKENFSKTDARYNFIKDLEKECNPKLTSTEFMQNLMDSGKLVPIKKKLSALIDNRLKTRKDLKQKLKQAWKNDILSLNSSSKPNWASTGSSNNNLRDEAYPMSGSLSARVRKVSNRLEKDSSELGDLENGGSISRNTPLKFGGWSGWSMAAFSVAIGYSLVRGGSIP